MMPKWQPGRGLGEDIGQISRNLTGLREDLKWLADDVKRLGSHQLELCKAQRMQPLKKSRRRFAAIRLLLWPSRLARAFSMAY